MKFKMIMVMAQDELTDTAIEAARKHGATGSTVITSARGEGLKPTKSFLGLSVAGQRDLILFLVEEHQARPVLEAIASACGFDEGSGTGVVIQIDIEDAIGLAGQISAISDEISKEEL